MWAEDVGTGRTKCSLNADASDLPLKQGAVSSQNKPPAFAGGFFELNTEKQHGFRRLLRTVQPQRGSLGAGTHCSPALGLLAKESPVTFAATGSQSLVTGYQAVA